MSNGDPNNAGERPGRRPAGSGRKGSGPVKQRGGFGFVERAMARGHSGNGAESVRPHLRDQLRLKALLPTPYPMPEPEPPKDD